MDLAPDMTPKHAPFLQKLSRSGPEVQDFEPLNQWVQANVGSRADSLFSALDDGVRRALHGALESMLTTHDTLLGFCHLKPHGYAGDFEIIDKIYTKHLSPLPWARKWDLYLHSQAAVRAVRNRKDYFKALLKEKLRKSEGPLRVLNLASGPARDIREFLDEYPELRHKVWFDCVDQDAKAIAYARDMVQGYEDRVTFVEANVFRFRPTRSYDLIWSAGLFDYFDDRTFARVLKRYTRSVAPGGELVIGNFHPRNPSQRLMQLVDWILNHRTEEELIQLASGAADESSRITVEQEKQGVNLFLRVSKGA